MPPPLPSREQRLRERLVARFAPALLRIEDESHLHAGHAGAASGQSHFRVTIVAEAFRGAAPLARHRMVYAAVDDLLKTDIHALSLEASPPAEASPPEAAPPAEASPPEAAPPAPPPARL
jgi:BolA protein